MTQKEDDFSDWYLDDELWAAYFPFIYMLKSFEVAVTEVDHICTLTGIQAGSVLDLCSGPARHSLEFAKRGFVVVGIEICRSAFDMAVSRTIAAGLKAKFIHQDVRDIKFHNEFDLALLMYNSFGYFASQDDDQRVLQNACAALRSEGKFLIELKSRELFDYPSEKNFEVSGENGSRWLNTVSIDASGKTLIQTWILRSPNKDPIKKRLKLRLYDEPELYDMLRAAGFGNLKSYGDLIGTPFSRHSKHLVVVGEKLG